MRANKYLTIVTAICSFFSVIIAIYIGKESNSIIYDVVMAIFGSALLGFIMSLIQYFAVRRESMEEFWTQAFKALNELRGVRPIAMDVPVELIAACVNEEKNNELNNRIQLQTSLERSDAMENLKRWISNNTSFPDVDGVSKEEMISQECNRLLLSSKETIQSSIESYKTISKYDTGLLDNAYGKLDFLFAKDLRKLAYDEVYKPIKESFNRIKKEAYHFELLEKNEGNFAVCSLKASELCDYFYEIKEKNEEDVFSKSYFQTKFDDITDALESFRCRIYRNANPEKAQRIPVTSLVRQAKQSKD